MCRVVWWPPAIRVGLSDPDVASWTSHARSRSAGKREANAAGVSHDVLEKRGLHAARTVVDANNAQYVVQREGWYFHVLDASLAEELRHAVGSSF